jgi:3-phenylpropionate/trans-cinnamate dioxygenase ferredoxin reductase subunit
MEKVIVVGASHGGAQIVASLRQQGWEGEILLIGDEPWLPYHRPPLSKTFLAEDKPIDAMLIRPAESYSNANITTLLGKRVTAIDPEKLEVSLDDGAIHSGSHIVLATGGTPRRLPLPGADLTGVNVLRDANDVLAIKERAKAGNNAVIIGGGYIGLETAASLRKMGVAVTLLEAEDRILARVTGPTISAFYQRVHGEEGVNIITGARIACIEGDSEVSAVLLQDGTRIDADLVVMGVGINPNTELAEAAGLKIDNGIVVDETAKTSANNIYAIGDCTQHYNPLYQRWIRLESIQNATDQAKVAAAAICGKEASYNALPWFWSDQYDIKLQIAGLSHGFDEIVIRGSLDEGRSFAAFYLQAGKLIACDAVNRPMEFMVAKRLLTEQKAVDSAALSDESVDIKTLLQA